MTISLFRRGFVQMHAGRQTRDMTRWFWSCGPDGIGWFGWSFHVPRFTFWLCVRYRHVSKGVWNA